MITVEQARKKLPERYGVYTDEEIQKILDFFYTIAYSVIEEDDKNES